MSSKFEILENMSSYIWGYMFACIIHNITNRIGGVIVNVLASSEVDRGFEPPSGQDYKNNICCFSVKHAA